MSQTDAGLARRFAEAHPIDAARVLQRFPPAECSTLLAEWPAPVTACVISHMLQSAAADCLAALAPTEGGRIVAAMPAAAAVPVLRWIDDERREALLAGLPEAGRRFRRLLRFPEDTAGSLMDPRVVAVTESMTAGETRARLEAAGQPLRYYVYVVDASHRLVGVVTLRDLLQAPEQAAVASVMRRDVSSLAARDPIDTVRTHPKWTDVHALPVVDEGGVLVGVVRYQTFAVLQRRSGDQTPVEAAVHAATAFGEMWWGTLAGMADELVETLGPERVMTGRREGAR